jgi:hypothetical protein
MLIEKKICLEKSITKAPQPNELNCIGVLPATTTPKIPGIVCYGSDDSDDSSSDSEVQSNNLFDLCGRRIQRADDS